MTHTVETAFKGGMQFSSAVGNHHVIMDAGTEDGGSDSGASPKKLMLASLAGCTGMDIVSILNKMKVAFSDFSVKTEAELTDEHPKIYNKVRIIYSIKIPEENKDKMEKAVKLSMDKYCGVSAMFSAFAKVDWEINYLPETAAEAGSKS